MATRYAEGAWAGDPPPDLAGTELHGLRGHRTGEIAPVEKTPPWDKLL